MSTTDILFNSPALHSLKRAQLVQLCKKHSIKASGKNAELVARLKEHARGLPSGAPLSIAVRSETEPDVFDDGVDDGNVGVMTDISDEDKVEEQLTSPANEGESQAWDIVSRGSVESKRSVLSTTSRNQVGEFGLATHSKSTILRSIASSIGLARSPSNNSIPSGDSSDSLVPVLNKKDKDASTSPKPRSIFSSLMPRSRANSHESQTKAKEDTRKSLLTNAIPYNDIPMPSVSRRPQIEPFAFSYAGAADTSLGDESMASLDRPVPGVGPCFSVNANNGVGTVRLITSFNKPPENEDEVPKLAPVIPAFDLIPPTPGKTGLYHFPVTPEVNRTLYPTITEDDKTIDLEALASPTKKASKKDVDKTLPDLPEPSPVSLSNPKEPFVFGSPNPRHSTTPADFTNAASSVLAEMNARLNAAGGRAVDADVLAHATGQRTKTDVEALLNYEFGGSSKDAEEEKDREKEDSIGKKFEKLHEKAFARMDGIDTHYAAKRALRDKSAEERLEPLTDNRKRKQSVLGTRKSTAPVSTKKTKASDSAPSTKTSNVTIPGAFETEEMSMDESVSRTEVTRENEKEEVEEESGRSAKRACVEEPDPDGSGKTRQISIVPQAHKDISDNGEQSKERKRKQSEAIKRRLELNKARRRSGRGQVSTAPRTPTRKKGFLASAKTFVKSVLNRGGNPAEAKASSSGPSYLRATASSSGKTHEQEAKPAPMAAMGTKPTVSRAASVHAASVGSGAISRKSSTSRKQPSAETALVPTLETVKEGNENATSQPPQAESNAQNAQNIQNAHTSGPILGSVKPRKPSGAALVTRNPSGRRATTTVPSRAPSRSSRLLAPTASSLAKVNASPTKLGTGTNCAPLHAKTPSVRGRASVMSPSKIPVFSPPHRKNQSIASPTASGKRIFGSSFVLPSSPQARAAAEKGQDVNPITGAVTPQRQRVPFSSANRQAQSLMGVAAVLKKGAETVADEGNGIQNESPTKVNKALNSLRKPRISRAKIISRLGARTGPGSPGPSGSPAKTASIGKGPATPKVHSSTSMAARRSFGGPKARESNGDAVMLSAKKRARVTEYARRKSAKTPIRGPDFSKAHSGDAMEVDS